jgi:hypothetical protein
MPETSKCEVAGDAGRAKGSGFHQIEEDKLLTPIRIDWRPNGQGFGAERHTRRVHQLNVVPSKFFNDFHKRQDSTPDVIWIFDRGRMDNRACSTF